MKKTIIKTAEQAEREQTESRKRRTCPSCGNIAMIGTTRDEGFFRIRTIDVYTCSNCGTKWEVED